jgi:hypothetical protein
MKNFPGLAIGGPLDGQLVENNSGRFHLLEEMPMPVVAPSPIPPFNNAPLAVEYVHVSTPVGVHFWLFQGETLESALTKLALVYIQSKL